MDHPNEERAAESLWSRFRDIAMALRRLQEFNFSAEGAEGRFTARWLEGLIRDEGVLAGVGRELVLRAFRAGAEAINFEILRRLRGGNREVLNEGSGRGIRVGESGEWRGRDNGASWPNAEGGVDRGGEKSRQLRGQNQIFKKWGLE
jgi:hypothetical protein